MTTRVDAANVIARAFESVRHLYAEGTLEVLLGKYAEEHRHYHNETHIAHLLDLLERFQDQAIRPDLLLHAILWHDAVYITRNPDGSPHPDCENVRKSAELFQKHAAKHMPDEDINAVFDIIMVTNGHKQPKEEKYYKGFIQDAGLMLAFDLHSLAMDPEEFDANTASIRKEFAWSPIDKFNENTVIMLSKFNARDDLYDAMPEPQRTQWTQQAHANLTRSIARLSHAA